MYHLPTGSSFTFTVAVAAMLALFVVLRLYHGNAARPSCPLCGTHGRRHAEHCPWRSEG